jgi:hypothetical protein
MVAYANDLGGSHCPKKNEVCIVRFPYGQWYRAFCAGLDSDGNRYIFQQVDYGEKHTVDASDIHCILKSLVNFLPFWPILSFLKERNQWMKLNLSSLIDSRSFCMKTLFMMLSSLVVTKGLT